MSYAIYSLLVLIKTLILVLGFSTQRHRIFPLLPSVCLSIRCCVSALYGYKGVRILFVDLGTTKIGIVRFFNNIFRF